MMVPLLAFAFAWGLVGAMITQDDTKVSIDLPVGQLLEKRARVLTQPSRERSLDATALNKEGCEKVTFARKHGQVTSTLETCVSAGKKCKMVLWAKRDGSLHAINGHGTGCCVEHGKETKSGCYNLFTNWYGTETLACGYGTFDVRCDDYEQVLKERVQTPIQLGEEMDAAFKAAHDEALQVMELDAVKNPTAACDLHFLSMKKLSNALSFTKNHNGDAKIFGAFNGMKGGLGIGQTVGTRAIEVGAAAIDASSAATALGTAGGTVVARALVGALQKYYTTQNQLNVLAQKGGPVHSFCDSVACLVNSVRNKYVHVIDPLWGGELGTIRCNLCHKYSMAPGDADYTVIAEGNATWDAATALNTACDIIGPPNDEGDREMKADCFQKVRPYFADAMRAFHASLAELGNSALATRSREKARALSDSFSPAVLSECYAPLS